MIATHLNTETYFKNLHRVLKDHRETTPQREGTLIDLMTALETLMIIGRRMIMNGQEKALMIVMLGIVVEKEKRKEGKRKLGKGLEKEKVRNPEIIVKETGIEVLQEGLDQDHFPDQDLGHIQGHHQDLDHQDVLYQGHPDVQDHQEDPFQGHLEELLLLLEDKGQ
mgnify:CR=1 FL=1